MLLCSLWAKEQWTEQIWVITSWKTMERTQLHLLVKFVIVSKEIFSKIKSAKLFKYMYYDFYYFVSYNRRKIRKKSWAFINRKWFHKLLYFYSWEYYAIIWWNEIDVFEDWNNVMILEKLVMCTIPFCKNKTVGAVVFICILYMLLIV